MIILINDKGDKRISELRESLYIRGIMSAVVSSTSVRDFPEAITAFVIVDSEDMLNTVSVRCGRLPLLVVNESGSRIYNRDVLFFEEGSYEELVIDHLREKHGIAADIYKRGSFIVEGATVQYGIKSIKLTHTELDILRLAIMCRGKWISEKCIETVCFSGRSKSARVSVHICNLNKKFRTATGRSAILCKRGTGYRLGNHL